MSDLPQTEERYDAARIEDAVAAFGERVQELESVAAELREELRALRSERLEQERLARRPQASDRYEDESWPLEDDPRRTGLEPTPGWIASVPAPTSRTVAFPRFAFEAVFLLLTALLAGLADLSTTVIVIVMATALALVVLSEVAAAAKRARWRLDAVAGPVGALEGGASESTGPWSMPVVEATVVEAPDDSESHTVVTKLPPELEPEAEAVPKPELESPPEPDEPEPEPEPEVVPEPDVAPNPEPEAEPKAEPEPESEVAPDPEPEARHEAAGETETAEPAPTEAADEGTDEEPSILPVESDPETDPEAEAEPKRRFGLFRRKRREDDPAETPDPWEI